MGPRYRLAGRGDPSHLLFPSGALLPPTRPPHPPLATTSPSPPAIGPPRSESDGRRIRSSPSKTGRGTVRYAGPRGRVSLGRVEEFLRYQGVKQSPKQGVLVLDVLPSPSDCRGTLCRPGRSPLVPDPYPPVLVVPTQDTGSPPPLPEVWWTCSCRPRCDRRESLGDYSLSSIGGYW